MLSTSLAPWPSFSQEEIDAVARVIGSNRVNYWTGDECRQFEKEFAAWCGVSKAIALANGTVALDLALKGLGLGDGDEVVVTPRTFIASASSVATAGGTPVFADVDLNNGNITRDSIAAVLTERTKAIIPVHLAGWPCDMPAIMQLARDHSLVVIEDCAQSHGALIDGRSVGSFGDVGAWSFCQDKIITTGGEGGMVTTDNEDLWSSMWAYKDHGKSWDAVYNREHGPGFRWLHETIGTNWRMMEIQAVIGRIQLRRLADWSLRREEIAMQIKAVLDEFPECIHVPVPASNIRHAYYRLYAYVKPEGLKPGWSRDRIVEETTTCGTPLFQGSCSEVYLEKAFDNTPWRPLQRLPNARKLGETSLMFLTHPTLSDADVAQVCDAVRSVLEQAQAG